MQVQSTNRFTSEIRSSFDCHRAKFINNLSAVFDSSTLKKNEHRSIECLSVNTSFFRSFSEQQSWDEWQNDKDHQNTTRDHWEVYFLSKIIKLSKKLLKSELLQSSNEIKIIANHIKNTRYIRNMKWIFETQWSQKQDHQTNKMRTLQITDAWAKRRIEIDIMLCKMSQNQKSVI